MDTFIVGSVATLGRKGSSRIKKFEPGDFSAIISDECFPAGTLIDGTPIEKVVAGDMVWSYDESTDSAVKKRVVRTFKNSVSAELIRIASGSTEIVCTPNHPIFTHRGWINARDLSCSDRVMLSLLAVVRHFEPVLRSPKNAREEGKSLLLRSVHEVSRLSDEFGAHGKHQSQVLLGQDEDKQSDGASRFTQEGAGDATGNGAQAEGTRGQRNGPHSPAEDIGRRFRLGYGGFCLDREGTWQRVSDRVQAGRWKPRDEDWGGSRGKLTWTDSEAGAGPQEGCLAEWAWVDRVEVFQQGDPERSGGMPRYDYVYNLEVEDTHTYFANGFLVHNCHHLPGDTRWQRIMDHFGISEPGSGILSLGLTATPNRSDGKGLRPWYDEVVFERSLLDCIKMGLLCDLKCYAIRTDASLDNVHIKAGKFNDAELSKEINTPQRNALIVRSWMKHAFEKRTLGFTQNVQHALDLAEVFKAFAVSAVAVWGEDPERDAKVKAHRNGEYTVMLNAQMLREGYDDDKIECVLLAAPHLSPLPVAQEVGRVTRIPDDVSRRFGSLHEAREAGYPITKEYGIVLDFVDSSRHPLCTVPSLMGMPKDLDLKGAPASKAKERLERVAQQFPTANLADLKDLSKLDAITKQIELFTVKYPVEIKTLTELAWRQQGEGYWLPVDHGRLTLAQDLRGDWWTRGTIAGKPVEIHAQNLAGAFNAADRAILETGNKALYVRDARWRDTVPSEKQTELCRKLKIHIPSGATRGMVSAALDAHFAAKTKRPSPAPVVYHGDY